jgi:hypothetical protein
MYELETLLEFTEKIVYESTNVHLNDLQRMILRESWQSPHKTYDQLAAEHNYSGNYIQQVAAPRLWRMLSAVLGEKVTKSNVRSVIERQLAPVIGTDRGTVTETYKMAFPKLVIPNLSQAYPLEHPTGSVPLNSPFYIERSPQEPLCYQTILQPNALIRIKAPRQMGKTSLMSRILHHAKMADIQTVTLNFQQVEKEILADLNKLLRWVCTCISQKLKLTPQLSRYWDDDIGHKMSCTLYLEGYILEEVNGPLVLALEEISELFDYPAIAQEFLTLLRAWHEQSKTDETWQNLRLILVQSTENYINLNVNQSPFNVGLEMALLPFTAMQVEELIDLHGLKLTATQSQQLFHLVQGHPYLIRWALYHLVQSQGQFSEMMTLAATEVGIYHDHLHRHLGNLQQHPELATALQQVLQASQPVELEQVKAFKLHSMGLVRLVGNQATIACDLYRQYFSRISTD